ncbi:MAG: 6-carboxytetrahydropterin synthase [Phycisphaerales bacterium]|nr:6-carboxytetrahydropterin synthase [Phycisphaerales bacterium]
MPPVTLTRAVRFCTGPAETPPAGGMGYSGRPGMGEVGAFHEMSVRCEGEIGPKTGYLVDIKAIDQAVREHAAPIIAHGHANPAGVTAHALMAGCLGALAGALPGIFRAVRWNPSPYHAFEMSTAAPQTVLIAQRYDFAAAHRLHAPTLSDEENRRLYGKCNNPRGHGHNYQFEPRVAVPLSTQGPPAFTHARLTSLCEATLIKPFDHTHLNEDTREFNTALGGLIPSVENIARVFYERLAKALAAEPGSPRLVSMTVWETDRTSATWAPG